MSQQDATQVQTQTAVADDSTSSMPAKNVSNANVTSINATTTIIEQHSQQQSPTQPEKTSNSLKRVPTDGVERGDNKRKVSPRNIREAISDSATLADNAAAAILTNVNNSSTTQPTSTSQTVPDPTQVMPNHQQFAEVISAATSLANQLNAPIAVAPMPNMNALTNNVISSQSQGIPANMDEFLQNAAAVVQAAQAQQVQPEASPGSKRNTSLRNLTNDERRQRRLLRNRVAAKECRRKKKAYVAELEEKVARLETENSRLQKLVEELNAKITLSAMRIDDNVRLIKEVEELNTKLAMTAAIQQEAKRDINTEGSKESTESKP
ncbi:9455_t:CDS:1 [Paraglomus brasilianum]|uniref:9455_t:CDS:1 n=1 Tax=Paraglomus brasilianum TaxID=144538 RepID=A0A9N8Z2Q1_9GLOM|nr:9455_t:CDS:1 [Paraglomus brasilianum]